MSRFNHEIETLLSGVSEVKMICQITPASVSFSRMGLSPAYVFLRIS
jgi:hypothetical protein